MNRERAVKFLLTLTCCMAVSSVASEPKNSKTLPPADEKQQVLDVGKEWVAAEVKHDATTLRRILDDKFVASFVANKPYDKEGFIKQILTGDIDPTESQTLTDETVVVDGDTAGVVGMRVLIAWIYTNTKSVLLTQLMHVCSTGSLVIFSAPRVTALQEVMWYALYGTALWAVVAIVVKVFGRGLGQRGI